MAKNKLVVIKLYYVIIAFRKEGAVSVKRGPCMLVLLSVCNM